LFRKIKIIVVAPLITATLAFLISIFLLKPQYEATALVIIMKPSLITELETKIQMLQQSPQLEMPPIEERADLAESDEILQNVYQNPEVVSQRNVNSKASFEDFKDNVEAISLGTTQLKLTVSDTIPEKSATIANIWSQAVVERLNALYGMDEETYTLLETQYTQAEQKLETKQAKLEAYLSDSRIVAIEGKIDQTQTRLDSAHNTIAWNKILLSDIAAFDRILSNQSSQAGLLFEDFLTLLAFRRRVMGSYDDLQFQIQIDREKFLGNDYSVERARENLRNLINSLEKQNDELEEEIIDLENAVTNLNAKLEKENYHLDQLRLERDMARDTYQALAGQLEENRISLDQQDQIAKVSAQAIVPEEPVAPRILLNTVLAGIFGLMLMIGVAFFLDWWQASLETEAD
jgi:uncharacterized protein involved in exopolysaccharide biosynthesis